MNIQVRKATEEDIEKTENWPVWSKEISEFSWSYNEQETCLILSGKAQVISDDGSNATFEAGDFVIFPKGLECQWKILEAIEKKYNFG